MASTNIREFQFFDDYLWRPEDFENFQLWLTERFQGAFDGLTGGAVLSGLKVTPAGGMNVNISAGIGVTPSGRIIVVPSTQTVALVADGSNPRRSYVVLRPTLTNAEPIPEPLNPTNTVYLHQALGFTPTVISGTASATPVYPSTASDDLVLMGVLVATAETSLQFSDFETYKISLPRRKMHSIRLISAAHAVDGAEQGDEILECDATSGAFTVALPEAESMIGRMLTILKIDSSSNVVTIDANGSETISGDTTVDLSSQWQSAKIYSNGISWRIV